MGNLEIRTEPQEVFLPEKRPALEERVQGKLTAEEAHSLIQIFYASPHALPDCKLCHKKNIQSDMLILLNGEEFARQKMGDTGAEHYGHLTSTERYFGYLASKNELRLAHPIRKLQWAQQNQMDTFFTLIRTVPETESAKLSWYKLRSEMIKNIAIYAKIEGEMSGSTEAAKVAAQIKAESTAMMEEELLSHEDRVQLSKAFLRSAGYSVAKKVSRKGLNVEEDTSDEI